MVFESEVERTPDGYEYRYRLTNKGDTSVRVEWRALEESAFGEAVDDIAELRIGPLDAGTVSDWLVLTSGSPPTVNERPARMLGNAPSGNESVQFAGPAPRLRAPVAGFPPARCPAAGIARAPRAASVARAAESLDSRPLPPPAPRAPA